MLDPIPDKVKSCLGELTTEKQVILRTYIATLRAELREKSGELRELKDDETDVGAGQCKKGCCPKNEPKNDIECKKGCCSKEEVKSESKCKKDCYPTEEPNEKSDCSKNCCPKGEPKRETNEGQCKKKYCSNEVIKEESDSSKGGCQKGETKKDIARDKSCCPTERCPCGKKSDYGSNKTERQCKGGGCCPQDKPMTKNQCSSGGDCCSKDEPEVENRCGDGDCCSKPEPDNAGGCYIS